MKGYRSHGIMVTVEGTSIKKGIILLIICFMMTFLLTGIMTTLSPKYRISSSSINNIANNLTGESLVYLLGYENHYFTQSLPKEISEPNYASLIFKSTTNINLDDPRSFLGSELPGYSLYDGEIIVAGEGTNYTNMPIESAPPIEVLLAEREASIASLEELQKPSEDKVIPPPVMTTGDKKVVYIYHTHSRESYLPLLKGVTEPNSAMHSKANVTLVGERLASALEKRGIGSVVDKTDFTGMLLDKGLNYGKSYDISRDTVQSAMTSNRDLQYFIDIHRDALRRDKTTATINGKTYAKTYFIIGGNNANFEKNVLIAEELHKLLEQKYPGLSRGILKKKGEGMDGKYNQDLSSNAMLIEFGGVDNTMEELSRTAEAVAEVFAEYYWQAEKVNTNTTEGN
ncbi:stage II sporulation protein P [Bacillus timonensis]|nr:stage II sporulation protein P [Bacillus timonensis]